MPFPYIPASLKFGLPFPLHIPKPTKADLPATHPYRRGKARYQGVWTDVVGKDPFRAQPWIHPTNMLHHWGIKEILAGSSVAAGLIEPGRASEDRYKAIYLRLPGVFCKKNPGVVCSGWVDFVTGDFIADICDPCFENNRRKYQCEIFGMRFERVDTGGKMRVRGCLSVEDRRKFGGMFKLLKEDEYKTRGSKKYLVKREIELSPPPAGPSNSVAAEGDDEEDTDLGVAAAPEVADEMYEGEDNGERLDGGAMGDMGGAASGDGSRDQEERHARTDTESGEDEEDEEEEVTSRSRSLGRKTSIPALFDPKAPLITDRIWCIRSEGGSENESDSASDGSLTDRVPRMNEVAPTARRQPRFTIEVPTLPEVIRLRNIPTPVPKCPPLIMPNPSQRQSELVISDTPSTSEHVLCRTRPEADKDVEVKGAEVIEKENEGEAQEEAGEAQSLNPFEMPWRHSADVPDAARISPSPAVSHPLPASLPSHDTSTAPIMPPLATRPLLSTPGSSQIPNRLSLQAHRPSLRGPRLSLQKSRFDVPGQPTRLSLIPRRMPATKFSQNPDLLLRIAALEADNARLKQENQPKMRDGEGNNQSVIPADHLTQLTSETSKKRGHDEFQELVRYEEERLKKMFRQARVGAIEGEFDPASLTYTPDFLLSYPDYRPPTTGQDVLASRLEILASLQAPLDHPGTIKSATDRFLRHLDLLAASD